MFRHGTNACHTYPRRAINRIRKVRLSPFWVAVLGLVTGPALILLAVYHVAIAVLVSGWVR